MSVTSRSTVARTAVARPFTTPATSRCSTGTRSVAVSTPHHGPGSSVNQLRGDSADGSDLASFVDFLEPLECAAQHEVGRHARLVTRYAGEERSRSNAFSEILRNHRPWTDGPTVILVEADFGWRRTIDDAALAEIIGTAQFLDRQSTDAAFRRRRLSRWFEVQRVVRGIPGAAAGAHGQAPMRANAARSARSRLFVIAGPSCPEAASYE